jgi:hypothetical protein
VTRQTWEEERDARYLARVLLLLEENQRVLLEILKRLPPPPVFRPTTGIAVIVDPVQPHS